MLAPNITDGYIPPSAAARHLGLAESTLAKARVTGTGPRFARFGHRSIRYRIADLDVWAAERLHSSTGAYTRREKAA